MDAERWQQVEALFEAALGQAADERAAFLGHQCADDPELHQEVLGMLAAEQRRDGLLDRPVMPLPPRREYGDGSRVGPYRIVRRLGQGGMGVIYLAERDDGQYRQQVAVKVLREGMDSADLVRRFRHERQVLARLEHPYIARLLDGGTTDDGLPYLVLEYVEGEAIDHYCEAQHLSLRQRLELFRKVCAGVQFLHQHLILHRDLKPANILVRADGEPKLLDFGIAKLLQPDTLALTMTHTTGGATPMTVDYASPEQVRGEGLTTASDVYSLGVLLYRLLTGHNPHRPTRSLPDKLDQICHQEPEPPSRMVQRSFEAAGPQAPPAAAVKTRDVSALQRRLAGDLDAILLKALDKQPQRRYATAEQLGADLQRHLEGLPVVARRPTVAYRAGKLLRRHWRAVAVAAAVLVMLVGFSINLRRLRDRALLERDRAEAVSEEMVQLFQASNPQQARGEAVTARQLLERGAERIRTQFQDHPALRATLLDTMGRSYYGLGLYADAEPLLADSLTLRRQNGARTDELAASLLDLGHTLLKLNRLDEAEALFREALSLLEAEGRRDQLLATTYNSLAGLYEDRQQLVLAERFYRQALEIRQKIGGRPQDLANSWNNLAALLLRQGQYAEAETYARQALKVRRELYGSVSDEVAKATNTLANVLLDAGRLPEAEQLLVETVEIRRQLYGESHPTTAAALNNLGYLRFRQDRLAEAEDLYHQALRVFSERLVARHQNIGIVQRNLAEVLLARGDVAGAAAAARQAVDILRASPASGSWRVADAESVLGSCQLALGEVEPAAALLRGSYQQLVRDLGATARQTREARARLRGLPAPEGVAKGVAESGSR